MLTEANKRNPDLHDCYLTNDHYGYGVIEVIENEIKKICASINKANYVTAYDHMTAVSVFFFNEPIWMYIDDGDRVKELYELFTTIWGAIHKGLNDTGKFNATAWKAFDPLLRAFEEKAMSVGAADGEEYWPWSDNYKKAIHGDAITRFKKLYKKFSFTGKKKCKSARIYYNTRNDQRISRE